MVKFKVDNEERNVTQRYVESCRGSVFKVRSMINPEFCSVKCTTPDLRTY